MTHLQASLKAEALARQQLRALQGGADVTMSGCQCQASYSYNGDDAKGCITDASNVRCISVFVRSVCEGVRGRVRVRMGV